MKCVACQGCGAFSHCNDPECRDEEVCDSCYGEGYVCDRCEGGFDGRPGETQELCADCAASEERERAEALEVGGTPGCAGGAR